MTELCPDRRRDIAGQHRQRAVGGAESVPPKVVAGPEAADALDQVRCGEPGRRKLVVPVVVDRIDVAAVIVDRFVNESRAGTREAKENGQRERESARACKREKERER